MNLWQRDGVGVRGLDLRSYGLDIWGSGISSGDDIIYSCSMPCKIIDPFIPIVEQKTELSGSIGICRSKRCESTF